MCEESANLRQSRMVGHTAVETHRRPIKTYKTKSFEDPEYRSPDRMKMMCLGTMVGTTERFKALKKGPTSHATEKEFQET